MAGDLVAECVHDVVQEVVKDATDLPLSLSLYPVFDGLTQYATIPQWDNVSADYTIEADTDNDDGYIVPATAPVTEIGRVGANYHSGNIKSVSLVDHSPLQGGSFVTGNAGGTRAAHLAIPQLPAGSTFDFHYLAKTAAADQVLLGASEASALLTHTDADTLTFGGDVTVEVDGVAVTSGSHSFNADQHYSIAVTLVNPLTITHIGTDSSDTSGIQLGVIGEVEAFNASTGDLYTLTGKNDSGNLLLNSSAVDRLGPELYTRGDIAPGTTPDETLAQYRRYHTNTPLEVGALYRISATPDGHEGGAVGWSATSGIPNGAPFRDDYPIAAIGGVFTATSTTPPILFFDESADPSVGFKDISIRRIHALGTAEGGWDDIPLNTYTVSNGTASISGDVLTLMNASFGALVRWSYVVTPGDVLEFSFLAKSGTAPKASYSVRDATNSVDIIVATEYSASDSAFTPVGVVFRVPDGCSTVWLYAQRQGGEGDLSVKQPRIRPVTHSIWHESGTAMTDEDADSARDELPRIDQKWKFNRPGEICEQYSGEQAVLTNLDETDWQKP